MSSPHDDEHRSLTDKFDLLDAGLRHFVDAFRANASETEITSSTVAVDLHVAPADQEAVRAQLDQLGFEESGAFGAVVSGRLPIAALAQLQSVDMLASVSLASAVTGFHEVISQGDPAQGSENARSLFDIDGDGVAVGVMSDSYESGLVDGSLAEDIRDGELPRETLLVLDDPSGTDEGRGMAQIVHDVAPGAELLLRTASFGEGSFAHGILQLADLGADVIVDDIIYLTEPMFMDGIVAQAVEEVAGRGVVYVSAAGNDADQSYQSAFRGIHQQVTLDGLDYDTLHDFDPGAGVDTTQSIRLARGDSLTISFQWDEPFFSATGGQVGSASDLDIFLLDNRGRVVASGADDNIDGDAVEILEFSNRTRNDHFELIIALFDGPAPNLIKYVEFDGAAEIAEFDTGSGTVFGHAAAASAISVGASSYLDTPEFGVDPASLREFSANGEPTPILFDTDGQRLAQPELRQSVDIVGPDGVDTTFFGSDDFDLNGLPNFSGTSAAAPHVAGLAALMIEQNPELWPEDVQEILHLTGSDMDDPFTRGFDAGIDPSTGGGLVDAVAAIAATDAIDRITIAEFGRIEAVSSERQTIELRNDFDNPVVIVGPPTQRGSDPGTFRIASVGPDRFDVRFDEPNYQDGAHIGERLSYLVVEAGRWELPDGTLIEAGTVDSAQVVGNGFERVDFATDFDQAPTVLSQIQTDRGGDYAITRMAAIDDTGFDLAMQEEEARLTPLHVEETIGYLAIEEGVHSARSIDFQAGSFEGVDSYGRSLRFDDIFAADDPLIFASIASFNGPDPAALRLERSVGERVRLGIEEEQSQDAETYHAEESVDFLVFDGPGRIVIEETDILSV